MATIQEMEHFATNLPEISFSNQGSGNIIEVNDINDDMGMSLLANSKYTGGQSQSQSQSYNPSYSVSQQNNQQSSYSVSGISSGLEEIDVQRIDTLEPISINLNSQPMASISINHESFQPSGTFGSDGSFGNNQSSSSSGVTLPTVLAPPRDLEKERQEKSDIINKLQRLEAKGFPVVKRFTMDNTLEEVKAEYGRLVDARNLETSIRFQRNMLMSVVTGVEWMNNKFDPFDLKLDGWSESIHENQEDYDEIFEELYDKYKERGKMPPEARLIFQLAGSGFMCHLTNSYFRKKMPSADDIFKNNPDLAKQFAAAAAQQAGPGFGNFMGMAMGMPPPQPAAPAQPMQPDTGAFFGSSRSPQMPQHVAAQNAPSVARKEMRGPSGVDDILRTFDEVRRAETEQPLPTLFSQPQNMSSAQMAASEIQSLHSDDLGSVGTERTAGGRRRRRQAPVGNVINLDV
jgi:hypothetical protein